MVYETNAPNLVASGLGVMVLAALLHAAALATAAAGLPLWVFTSTTALLGLRVDRWRPSTVVLAGLAYAGLDVWLDDVACQVAQAVSTCIGQMALWQPLTHVLVGARLLCWPLHYVLTALSRDETEWLLLQGAEDGSRPPIAIQRSLPGHRQVYVTNQLHAVLHGEASFARLPSGTVKVYATTARRVLEYGAFRLVVQNRGFTGEQLAQLDALHMNALRQQLLDAHADARRRTGGQTRQRRAGLAHARRGSRNGAAQRAPAGRRPSWLPAQRARARATGGRREAADGALLQSRALQQASAGIF